MKKSVNAIYGGWCAKTLADASTGGSRAVKRSTIHAVDARSARMAPPMQVMVDDDEGKFPAS